MKSGILVLLSACLLLPACKKRKYPAENVQLQSESIYVSGSVDNEPIELKIGANGYYCYSSHKQRADSIYVFTGELRKFDCNPCPLALRVELSDYRHRLPGSSVPADSVFSTGTRGFAPAMSKVNTVRFVSNSNKQVSSVRWDFSNGFSSQDPVLNYEFGQPGPQTLSLTIQTTGNCKSTVVNKLHVDASGDIFACTISTQTVQGATSAFNSGIIGGKAPFRYTWYFGDGSTSNQASPNHTYAWVGSYPVKLRVEDSNNQVCESDYTHIAGNDNSSCAANMSLIHTGTQNVFLNRVKLQWTNKSNEVLRSDSVAQPAGSYFEVIKSQAFEPNERGEPGQLLTLRFNVLLANGNHKVWFKSDNTAIAVTYK